MSCTGCQRRKATLVSLAKKVKAKILPKPRIGLEHNETRRRLDLPPVPGGEAPPLAQQEWPDVRLEGTGDAPKREGEQA